MTALAVRHEAPPRGQPALLVVDLDGFEGPLDLLLSLARTQRVDLRQISILQLANQYLAFIARAAEADLELAAEYLVMAAWLAYLKSRLLLPEPAPDDEPTPSEMAEALAHRLCRLQAMREAGAALMARPQLGRDVFPRGCAASPVEAGAALPAEATVAVSLYDLLAAYGRHLQRRAQKAPLSLPSFDLYPVDSALLRIRQMLAGQADWQNLTACLPEATLEGLRAGTLHARSALASTLLASLELAREGVVVLKQIRPFGPIALRWHEGGARPE
jgi:segregation and condensation protein A